MNAELKLDHIFVCTPSLATDAQRLVEFGLQPGRSRIHASQGTENVCFFFDNAYLELLGLQDEAEVRSPLVAPLGLWERLHWQQTGACPFGISLRLKAGTWKRCLRKPGAMQPPFCPPVQRCQSSRPPVQWSCRCFFCRLWQ